MPTEPSERSVRRARAAVTIALLAGIAVCWILLTPPGAGPDEPGHLVRSGGVIRGDAGGTDLGRGTFVSYSVPDTYRVPEPACYAFQPLVPVDCVPPNAPTGATVDLESKADEYPIWGHLVFGAASLAPGWAPVWWARLGGAAVAVALIGAALVGRADRQPLVAAGVLAALSPMAWSTFAQVNPSTFAIAGAVALWTSLLVPRSGLTSQWLLACGWTALALPRRDGLIWACLIVAVALLASGRGARDWWSGLGRGPQALVAASTLVTVAWGLTDDSYVTRALAAAPLAIVGVDVLRVAWARWGATAGGRVLIAGSVAALGAVGVAGVFTARTGGWDVELTRAIVGQTGVHLTEAIGVLGWLDTTLPALAVAGWAALLGVLAATALLDRPRVVAWAVAVLALAIVTAWTFELFQGNTTGRYWQGRYSLPVLAGIPLVLATARVPERLAARAAWIVGGGALVIVNVAAWSAARRWGVGIGGSLAPWRWDTAHAPVAPVLVLALHAVLTAALAGILLGDPRRPGDQADGRPHRTPSTSGAPAPGSR